MCYLSILLRCHLEMLKGYRQAQEWISAVFVATALAAAIGSLIMGIFAKYPIALAPYGN